MSPGLAVKQCVNGQCWMGVWLRAREPGSSFKSRALRAWSRLLVLGWLCNESMVVVLYVDACKLDLPSGADNRPSRSSKWDRSQVLMYTGHENKDRFSSRHWFTLQPVFSILPLPYPPPPPHPTPFLFSFIYFT